MPNLSEEIGNWAATGQQPSKESERREKAAESEEAPQGPKGIQKRHCKEVANQRIQRKQNAQPIVENTVKGRDSGGCPKELEQLHMVHRPGK